MSSKNRKATKKPASKPATRPVAKSAAAKLVEAPSAAPQAQQFASSTVISEEDAAKIVSMRDTSTRIESEIVSRSVELRTAQLRHDRTVDALLQNNSGLAQLMTELLAKGNLDPSRNYHYDPTTRTLAVTSSDHAA